MVASAGDILTEDALAAVAILPENFPDLKSRFVNVVDLYRLQPDTEHPHGLSERDFEGETVHLVANREFQWSDVALFLVAAYMNVGVVRPAVRELVDQPRICMEV